MIQNAFFIRKKVFFAKKNKKTRSAMQFLVFHNLIKER